MKQEKLALLGGPKTITEEFRAYNPYGREEVEAAKAVVESTVLSRFIGAWTEDFYGGEKVKAFEAAWSKYFSVPHTISVNSATSGLIAAVGAIGINPGDEVIVTPWTMSASATSIVVWGGIPVFADIDPKTFNLDPQSIRKNISPRTKAIMVADIFGQSADMDSIMAIAKEHGLKVIEDAAQAPGAMYGDRFVGTTADIGVFSLNYHKHIHTGEGGMCVTHDPKLAERMQLIRNHAESVVRGKGVSPISNMIGFNFRLGEIEAAMGIEQLKKLKVLAENRRQLGGRIAEMLSELEDITQPYVSPKSTHVYYAYPLTLGSSLLKIGREKIVAALRAEGVTSVGSGYQNIHLLPMYQQKIAFGDSGFPWVAPFCKRDISYQKGICPIAEDAHDRSVMTISLCQYDFSEREQMLLVKAFKKVWGNLSAL